MAATKLSIETKADGTGVVVPNQTFRKGEVVTVFAIGRDASDVFVSNVAADAWALVQITGGIVQADLVPAIDSKSAVFTSDADGDCLIECDATLVDPEVAYSGTLSVISIAIVSLADVKAYLGETRVDNDTILRDWIGVVSSRIEKELNQPVVSQVVEEIADGMGGSILFLNKGRIISLVDPGGTGSILDSLQSRSGATEAWVNIADDTDKVFLNPESSWLIELLDGLTFPSGQKNIRIAYNAGFSPVPGDIANMAKEMIQEMWDASKQGGDMLDKTVKSMGAGGMSTSETMKDLSSRWQTVIDRYKRYGVG